MGFDKVRTQSEPNRRAAQPQRVEQQGQMQITIHDFKLAAAAAGVNCFFPPLTPDPVFELALASKREETVPSGLSVSSLTNSDGCRKSI